MVTERPFHAAADRAGTACITCNLEVPDARRCCDDELAGAHNERIDPEEHEELVDDYVARVLIPLHLGDEWVVFARCWFTN